ncbi:ATP-dependent DNA helicase PIF1-like protein [Tanacetum coccineum]
MLLNVIRGLKDFDELMTVNNRLCHTFKEACFAYGLLNDDREWTKAVSEASLWALGPQLRDLFVIILLFCDVSRPLKLWEETWEFLSEDILHRKRKLYGEALNFDMNNSRIEHERLHPLLNLEQRLVYEHVIDSVNNQRGNDTVPTKAKDGKDEPTWIQIPEQFLIKSSGSPIENIFADTYPNFIERQHGDEYLKERAILTPKNDDVDEINKYMFNKLVRKFVTYNSADEICKASTESQDQQQLYPTEFLNTLNFLGMPPYALCLKRNCQ